MPPPPPSQVREVPLADFVRAHKPRHSSGGFVSTMAGIILVLVATGEIHNTIQDTPILYYAATESMAVIMAVAAAVTLIGAWKQSNGLVELGALLAAVSLFFCTSGVREWFSVVLDCRDLHSSDLKMDIARECYADLLTQIRGATVTTTSGMSQCVDGTRVTTWLNDQCPGARSSAWMFDLVLRGIHLFALLLASVAMAIWSFFEIQSIRQWQKHEDRLRALQTEDLVRRNVPGALAEVEAMLDATDHTLEARNAPWTKEHRQ